MLLRPPGWMMVAVCFATAALAQDDLTERARETYEHAQRQYDLGHFDDALKLFEKAYELKPVPALLFNIGQCNRQLGNLKLAQKNYQTFLRLDPQSRFAPKATQLLEQVEEGLKKQSAARESPPPGVPIDAAAKTDPLPPAVPPQALKPTPAPRVHDVKPSLVAGGVAVALLAGAGVEALASRSAANDLSSLHATSLTVDPARDQQLRASAASRGRISRVLAAASAVAAAAGVALYFVF